MWLTLNEVVTKLEDNNNKFHSADILFCYRKTQRDLTKTSGPDVDDEVVDNVTGNQLRSDTEGIFTVSSDIRGNIGCNESIENDDVESSVADSSDDEIVELNPRSCLAKHARNSAATLKSKSLVGYQHASGSSVTRKSQTFLGRTTSRRSVAVIKRHCRYSSPFSTKRLFKI